MGHIRESPGPGALPSCQVEQPHNRRLPPAVPLTLRGQRSRRCSAAACSPRACRGRAAGIAHASRVTLPFLMR